MNLRVLGYFIAVVEEGSLSRAAIRLRVAQPALSLHIRNLEADLGTELLLRTSRGVSPTESGCRLLSHARDLLSRADAAREDVRGYAATPVGPVTIGMTQSIAGVLALPLFREAKQRFPGIAIRFSESSTGHMPHLLRQQQMDLAVLFRSANDPSIGEQTILEEDLYLVGPPLPGCRDPSRGIAFAEAAAMPLILPGRPHSLRELINGYARKRRVALNVIAEVDAVPQLKEFVANGLGHTILAPACVSREVAGRTLSARRIVSPVLCRSVILCRSAEFAPSRAALAISDLVIKLAEQSVRDKTWPARLSAGRRP